MDRSRRRIGRAKIIAVALAFTCPAGQAALSCPLCASPQAAEVRAGFADDVTPKTLAALALPFLVVASVASLVRFGVPCLLRKA